LKEVKKHWDYPVSKASASSTASRPACIAVPVEVTLVRRPGAKKSDKLHYRSITSCCNGWSISKETFDKIANQHLGWQEALPNMMSSIRTGVPMPKRYLVESDEQSGPLFSIKESRGALVVSADGIAGRRFRRIQDLPTAVLAFSEWGGKKTSRRAS
jgi:hypothetical protein